jgi:parallel beta-helix repeat protein
VWRFAISLFAACAAPTSPTVNVRSFGATGDGVTDDTAAIQAAFDSLPNGGTIEIPDGTYLINASGEVGGLRPHSHQHIQLSAGAILQVAPTDAGNYEVLQIDFVDDVSVTGGTFIGDRASHLGTTGEWGHGITVRSSTNVTLEGITSRDFWGDGFYIGRHYYDPPGSEHVTVRNVIADHNRRQGMSITDATDVLVEDSVFENQGGTPPEAGIDLEPSLPDRTAAQITLRGNRMTNNHAYGILLVGTSGPTYANTVIENEASNNGVAGIALIGTQGGIVLTSNTVISNGVGIKIAEASDNDVGMNQITGSAADNVDVVVNSDRNAIHDNTIRSGGIASYGIQIMSSDCDANSITANDLVDAGTVAAYLDLGTGTVITGNSQ